MWDNAVTWILATLGLLVSANLLQRRSTRRVAALRARADLVAALPEGPGRDAMRDVVDQQATKLAELLERDSRDWLVRMNPAFDGLWWGGIGVSAFGVLLTTVSDGLLATIGVGTTLLGGLMFVVGALFGVLFMVVTAVRWGRSKRGR